ncbi:uncharacterized protein [Parasteatoda tepidariorum]|uniref:uncharacterized protein n=1 Tax=Parasteatoda tepidariorum TaxID=114398 RepID=UPI00077FA1B8|nr:uncharacterized protein LOC107444006 [Parasteatoda tepidariorum]
MTTMRYLIFTVVTLMLFSSISADPELLEKTKHVPEFKPFEYLPFPPYPLLGDYKPPAVYGYGLGFPPGLLKPEILTKDFKPPLISPYEMDKVLGYGGFGVPYGGYGYPVLFGY